MKQIELFVGLKIPDTTAITAFYTLERMGFRQLKKLERNDYYKFEIDGNKNDFKNKISKVDILVNANKNNFRFELEKNKDKKYKEINVLVKNINNGFGLSSTLRERLGFKDIKKIEKGVLWTLSLDCNEKEAKSIAEKIAMDLLFNENYQEFKII